MQTLKWLIVALALVEGGWLVFDGTRALVVGDYVTPAGGPRAGELGPWSRVVSALGLEPRSTAVKMLHVVLGLAWLAALTCFALRLSAGWWMLLCCAGASLWYLPIGTVIGVVEIALLLLPGIRKLY